MTASQKRPLGLKGRKQQQQQQQQEQGNENRQKKAKLTGELDSSFTTVALVSSSTNPTDQTSDGLTLQDLIQLKIQADELIDNPSGLDPDEDQLVNLLRGICHESIRQIEIAEQQEEEETDKTGNDNLPHQLLGWASLELGIFLTLHQQPDRFVQEDEPKTLEAWLSIVSKVVDNLPSKSPQKDTEIPSDLKLLPRSISLLKAEKPEEITEILHDLESQSWNREQSVYILRIIDRIILLKSEIISKNPTPIFNIFIKLLEKILITKQEEEEDFQTFKNLLDQRLGDCHLAHGSLLAEKLEQTYYPEQDETNDEEEEEEEVFSIDLNDPDYKLALENLKLAEGIFSKLIEDMDETNESRKELKTKLDETLLTIGNLLPPGSEREALYLRAGLNGDDEEKKNEEEDGAENGEK
ncbi:hypothetical protein Pst134EB_025318 [Puccinia striiformis f. sp. tritici]|uniref:Uncharacterized protein n=1 Tax=Puccinia striiformis f. sp. tritici PST-78 TaxID=1165861 RepID=A0A0L0VME6_9BASI|nr:hypothetical protein Pst134EB_025318 [Puccinia striiformis f. sp. tritici]KNF00426.1 hypothetical protein PSTG_06354 [Puccinia striiformis f. sp. tritici PST-78]